MREDTPPTSPRDIIDENQMFEDENDMIYIGDVDQAIDLFGDDDEDPNEEDELNPVQEVDDDEYLEEGDNSIFVFRKHTSAVFCCSIHPTLNVAVTGGEDDKFYVWNIENGDIIFQSDEHKDSVIATEFNCAGNYLATGDMAGEIKVYKITDDNNYSKVWEFSMGDMAWMMWHDVSPQILLAGAESGEVYIWRVKKDCKVLQGNGQKAECGLLTDNGKKLIVGYKDGTIKLWDIKTSTVILEVANNVPLGHSSSVISLATDKDSQLFLAGSVDGKISIIGPSGPIGNLFPMTPPREDSIEALAFCENCEELKLAASGTISGRITIWDIQRQSVRCQYDLGLGITKLLWTTDTNLLAGTLLGTIVVFEGRNAQVKHKLTGHKNQIYDMKYRKEGNYLLSVCEDNTARVFNLP